MALACTRLNTFSGMARKVSRLQHVLRDPVLFSMVVVRVGVLSRLRVLLWSSCILQAASKQQSNQVFTSILKTGLLSLPWLIMLPAHLNGCRPSHASTRESIPWHYARGVLA